MTEPVVGEALQLLVATVGPMGPRSGVLNQVIQELAARRARIVELETAQQAAVEALPDSVKGEAAPVTVTLADSIRALDQMYRYAHNTAERCHTRHLELERESEKAAVLEARLVAVMSRIEGLERIVTDLQSRMSLMDTPR